MNYWVIFEFNCKLIRLSSIYENGRDDQKAVIEGETVRYFSPSPTSPDSRDSGVVMATSTKSCDLHEDTSATFDNLSYSNTPIQSLDNLTEDEAQPEGIVQWFHSEVCLCFSDVHCANLYSILLNPGYSVFLLF